MKKVIAALAVVGALASCNESKETVAKPQTYMDSVSYMVGVMLAEQSTGQTEQFPFKDSLNMDLLKVGMKNSLDSNKIFSDSIITIIRDEFGKKLQASAQQEQMAQQAVAMQEHDAYMKEVATYDGIQKTESGIFYKVLEKGSGKKPASASSVVKVNYEGKLKDGTVFDKNDGIEFPLNGVIPGWTEGIQLMKEGAVYEFYFPQNLAYGPQGSQGRIPPYAPLYFKVKLVKAN